MSSSTAASTLVRRALGIALVLAALPGAPHAQAPAPRTPPPAPAFEVHEATIADMQRAMADGRTTAVALVQAYLARIAAYDHRGPELNAMLRLDPSALAQARRLDDERRAGHVRGPLHGIPIILKDNYDTRDLPTTGGSLAFANHRTTDDAFVVRRLRDAGAVILGKSNMHELAAGITSISSLGGQTCNPYDPRRAPGGSSGGTGAAIAASFAAVGWGSDTCGSIRIPASFGSLVGLRPSHGLASRTGIMPLSHTQDVPGPLARTIADLAVALDATVGADPADTSTRVIAGRTLPRFADSLSAGALRGARIGILTNYFTDADGEILDTVRSAIRAMRAAGADTIAVNVPGFDSLLAGTSVINYEHRGDLREYLARTPVAPITSVHALLDAGLEHEALETRFHLADTTGTGDPQAYPRALARQAVLRARITAVLDSLHLDALVYPTMRRKPVPIGETQLGSTCNLSAQTGLPALTMPAGFTADGLPVGVEMLGRAFTDVRLVSLGYAFEQLGARRRPPFSTPALVNGRAPTPRTFAAVARAGTTAAESRFVYDPLRSTLRYDVRVTGAGADGVSAVVLRRRTPTPVVVDRLSGPGMTTASGALTLGAADRAALLRGALALTVVGADGVPHDTALSPPP